MSGLNGWTEGVSHVVKGIKVHAILCDCHLSNIPSSAANGFFHVLGPKQPDSHFSLIVSSKLHFYKTSSGLPSSLYIKFKLGMGFQDIVAGCSGGYYQRLDHRHDEAVRSGRRWLRNLNGKMVALRLSSSKKLKWRCFPSIGATRRIAELYAGIAETAKLDEVVTPAVILSSQWGLPVFSHSSFVCKKKEISQDRKLS